MIWSEICSDSVNEMAGLKDQNFALSCDQILFWCHLLGVCAHRIIKNAWQTSFVGGCSFIWTLCLCICPFVESLKIHVLAHLIFSFICFIWPLSSWTSKIIWLFYRTVNNWMSRQTRAHLHTIHPAIDLHNLCNKLGVTQTFSLIPLYTLYILSTANVPNLLSEGLTKDPQRES